MKGSPDEEFTECELGDGLRGSAVAVGNPHLVLFVDDVAAFNLEKTGPSLENHPLFPHRINVHIAQVVDATHIKQRTWERGAGLTLDCGTGACAVAAAGYRTGRSDRKVEVQLPGGCLAIEYLENGNVEMTGPAETVYEGEIDSTRLLTYAPAA
jgi:diaminopimelate epimerase